VPLINEIKKNPLQFLTVPAEESLPNQRFTAINRRSAIVEKNSFEYLHWQRKTTARGGGTTRLEALMALGIPKRVFALAIVAKSRFLH